MYYSICVCVCMHIIMNRFYSRIRAFPYCALSRGAPMLISINCRLGAGVGRSGFVCVAGATRRRCGHAVWYHFLYLSTSANARAPYVCVHACCKRTCGFRINECAFRSASSYGGGGGDGDHDCGAASAFYSAPVIIRSGCRE